MNPWLKIKESTAYVICVVALGISVVGMMVAVATSSEENIFNNIKILIIQCILFMWTLIDYLKCIVRKRAEKEQAEKIENDTLKNTESE